jgi:hypothetical protein
MDYLSTTFFAKILPSFFSHLNISFLFIIIFIGSLIWKNYWEIYDKTGSKESDNQRISLLFQLIEIYQTIEKLTYEVNDRHYNKPIASPLISYTYPLTNSEETDSYNISYYLDSLYKWQNKVYEILYKLSITHPIESLSENLIWPENEFSSLEESHEDPIIGEDFSISFINPTSEDKYAENKDLGLYNLKCFFDNYYEYSRTIANRGFKRIWKQAPVHKDGLKILNELLISFEEQHIDIFLYALKRSGLTAFYYAFSSQRLLKYKISNFFKR